MSSKSPGDWNQFDYKTQVTPPGLPSPGWGRGGAFRGGAAPSPAGERQRSRSPRGSSDAGGAGSHPQVRAGQRGEPEREPGGVPAEER